MRAPSQTATMLELNQSKSNAEDLNVDQDYTEKEMAIPTPIIEDNPAWSSLIHNANAMKDNKKTTRKKADNTSSLPLEEALELRTRELHQLINNYLCLECKRF